MRTKSKPALSSFLQNRGEEIQKLVWYVIIGVVTYVINNLLLLLFRRVFLVRDIFAVALSFLLTSVCHFFLHNGITFRKSAETLQKKLAGHAVVTVINYFVGVTTATLVLRYIADSNLFATACSTAVTFVMGFTLLNRFVYKLQNNREDICYGK